MGQENTCGPSGIAGLTQEAIQPGLSVLVRMARRSVVVVHTRIIAKGCKKTLRLTLLKSRHENKFSEKI
jgi:hypothetical protein